MYKKAKILREIRENLGKGAGVYNACEVAGIKYITLWTWRNKRPMIERYIQKLLKQRVQLVEDALYKNALAGNTTAQIFYLKNRGTDWKDSPIVDQSTHAHYISKVRIVVDDRANSGNAITQQPVESFPKRFEIPSSGDGEEIRENDSSCDGASS